MGRKRKRGQAKQTWGITSSRKHKKRRKTRGNGFNRGAKVAKSVSQLQPSSTIMQLSCGTLSPAGEGKQDLTFPDPCSSKTARFFSMRNIFSRVTSFARLLQRSTLERFRSIRNVFLLLDWLKQMFGCGLQTLGKFLLGKDHLNVRESQIHSFEEIMRRMSSLEEEVKFLKSELSKETSCPCRDHSAGCTSFRQGCVLPGSVPILNAPPAPPPPPPPPPPVLPPPPLPLASLKNKQTESKCTSSKETKNKPTRTLVTLEDLRKVKLRKVLQDQKSKDIENVEPQSESEATGFQFVMQPKKASPKKNRQSKDIRQCVISLSEIKKVTLKRTKTETEVEKLKLRTPEEMVVMRRNLRKVNITRSPGGTPLVSQRNNENGTGLTPMMTKALRKKFQQAHPYSSPESPTGIKKKRQSFSPLADRSPNTPSPLLINKF